MRKSSFGSVDFATASMIKAAAQACLARVKTLPPPPTPVLPKDTEIAFEAVVTMIHRHNFAHHECFEDFLIYVEGCLWGRRFEEATSRLSESEKGEVRLAVRAHFKKGSL